MNVEKTMIDHISIAVSGLEQGRRFYAAVLGTLGLSELVAKPGTVGFGKRYPEFWINLRADMRTVGAESGAHVCLRAASAEAVSAFYAAAVENGGSAEAAPKMWPEYNERYFAAFVRDPDGNRIEVVHFLPQSD